ncbi:HIT family protein [Candidatus Woesearchaeota archaeon]|nr:HIT family protein [Candidatus Woesearchaeota archaeon]
MKNCIFCKIVTGDIPATKVYEDEHFIAFLDINPVAKGHTLLIPKKHYPEVFDFPKEVSEAHFPTIQKLESALKQALGARKIVLAVWGDDVAHAHTHLIPRYEGDHLYFFKQGKATPDDLVLQAEKIINLLD